MCWMVRHRPRCDLAGQQSRQTPPARCFHSCGTIARTGDRAAGERTRPMISSVPKRIGSGIELLADPTRRRIIALLAVRALRPSTIAAEIGLSRPAVELDSCRLLREAGLIERTRSFIDRRALVYRIPHWQLGPIDRVARRHERRSPDRGDVGRRWRAPSRLSRSRLPAIATSVAVVPLRWKHLRGGPGRKRVSAEALACRFPTEAVRRSCDGGPSGPRDRRDPDGKPQPHRPRRGRRS